MGWEKGKRSGKGRREEIREGIGEERWERERRSGCGRRAHTSCDRHIIPHTHTSSRKLEDIFLQNHRHMVIIHLQPLVTMVTYPA